MQQEDQSMNNETSFDRGTILFDVNNEKSQRIDDIMLRIYTALVEKGYNPVNQIVGYVMSGDPTYITSHGDARMLIQKVERDELLEELVKRYIDSLEGTEPQS